MPSLNRRRESDIRGERLESEVRQEDMSSPRFADARKFMCSRCRHLYEEKSRVCPRCDTRSMGELKPLTASEDERKRSIERARNGRGANLFGV